MAATGKRGAMRPLSSPRLQDLAARGRAAWTRLTPREQLLARLLVLLALVAVAYLAWGWSNDQRSRYGAAQAELLLTRQTRLTARQETSGSARAELAALSAWTIRGDNIWMVRLRLEQTLDGLTAAAGLPEPQIHIAEAVEGDAALPLIKAEITGPYVGQTFAAFLRNLAASDTVAIIDRLDISDVDTARYRLVLLFPVDVGPERGT